MSKARLLACAALVALMPVVQGAWSVAAAQAPTATVVDAAPRQFGFDRGRNDAVADRARPEFDSKGIRLGAIILRPSLVGEAGTDSNVFNQASNERDDIVLSLKPRLEAETNWSRHSLKGSVGFDDYSYQDNASEDHTDVSVRGEGRLDVVRGTYLLLGGRQERLTEGRGAPDSPLAAAKPVVYEVRTAYAGAVHEFNRARLSLRVERENLNYKDAPLIGGGVSDQDQRDHTTTTATGRAEYALSPDTAIVAQIAANMREYTLKPPRAGFNRDSEGASFLVGLNADLSKLVRGELIVGYLQQDYDDPALESAKGLALDANVQYFATPLTTLSVNAHRRVEETLTGGASSYVAGEAEFRVDHELRRNVILTAGAGVLNRDFQGMSRKDDVTRADIGARFLLNRRVELGARWRYERQNSSGPIADPDYDANRFVVSASLRL